MTAPVLALASRYPRVRMVGIRLLAAGNHILQPHRARLQNIAMASDAFAAVVLLVSFGGLIR